MRMEDRETCQELPERTQTYIKRRGIDQESSRWCYIRITLMILICIGVGSIIIYWLVNSIMGNRQNGKYKGSASGKIGGLSYLERLPNQTLPLEYTLRILPILDEGNFTNIGDVEIQFYSEIPTRHIRFHAYKLFIKDVSVREYRFSNTSKLISKYVITNERDFVDVFLMQILIARETYVLHVKYTASLDEKPNGLFRSSHIDSATNETKWIAVSNFSPNYARTAYPCFDEPWIKTPFRISIGRRANMSSHSNSMRKVTEKINDMPGYVWDHYEKTLPMPTYLVAFMVTDFSSYRVNVTDRPSHTIFFRKEITNSTRHIGDFVSKVLRSIQNFTETYYELDKLDVIVVPQLSYNAMENWGLISIKEDTALINKDGDFVDSERTFASIASHEIAHQWFGNLVTPKWWDDVWLKEGFSTFFGYLALSTLEPGSWDFQTTYLPVCQSVLDRDAEKTAHPLHIDLRYTSKLTNIFDFTSYSKGACVVRMIYHILGERMFFWSVRRYMHMYYYRNADQEDLWNAFHMEIDSNKLPAACSRLRMKDIMRTWTYQAGFPVLNVRQNRGTGAIELTQERFYHYGLNSTSEELWHIPLTWTTENEQQFGNTPPKAWMVKKHMKINDTALSRASSNNQWILFNINQTALCRVNYDIENWVLLTKSYQTLPEVTKAQLLTDSFAMVNAGLLDARIAWNILEKLQVESGKMLWTSAIPLMTAIRDHLWDSDVFKFVMCKFVDKVYDRETWLLVHMNPVVWTRFKLDMMAWTCSLGHRGCLTTVYNFAQRILRNDESSSFVSGEVRTWTYCTFVKVITENQWLALLKRYNDSTAPDKKNLAFALGCHTNASLLRRYLSIMISQKNITLQHAQSALTSVARNPFGYKVVIEFVTQYWNKFNENAVDENNNYANVTLTGALRALAKRIRQEEDLEWLQRLRGTSKKYDTVIEEIINKAQINVAWYRKHRNETLSILRDISVKSAETRNCRKQN